MSPSLKDRADKDKNFLINQTNEFLKNKDNFPIALSANREEIQQAIEDGNFKEALQGLEILREQKIGINLIKIEGKEGSSPILIRDGRNNTNKSRILGTEGFEMQYLNTARAAIELAKIENKPGLEKQIKGEARKFIKSFNALHMKESQINISKNIKIEIDGLAKLLGMNGIKEAHKKLNVAREFQNFNDEHCNIVTLSKITGKEGKDYTVIEAEVALKGLTSEQSKQYKDIEKGKSTEKWYTKMPPWERELVKNYAPRILSGEYVIPTQLRQIAGMRNAFEKITAITDPNGENFEILHNSKHAGTLASLSKDIDSRQGITDLNARQAQEWIGDSHTLHTNTLNSGPIGAGNDPAIVKLTRQAMKNVRGENTNTAFNIARLAGGANNLSGIKNSLEKISANLPEGVQFEIIKSHIKPRGRLSRLFGINKPKGNLEEALTNLDLETKQIIMQVIELRKDVEKADVPFRIFRDKENINLKISTNFNSLTEEIAKVKEGALSKIPKEEILTMCASGKDRTGLAEHDQTAQAVSRKTNIDIKDLDMQLLKNGHTANQTGSIYAGGATIGCYGTKGENKAGIPKSRKETLAPIMEVTSKTNKIEDKKQMDKKIDKEYQKNHSKNSTQKHIKEATQKIEVKTINSVKQTSSLVAVPVATPAVKQSVGHENGHTR